MPNIFNVAEYILSKLGKITTMKLQKICFYAQAWSLAWDDVPLFDEEFQAWANGPVCPELFKKHKGAFEISYGFTANPNIDCFSKSQLETLDSVIEHYGDKDAYWLRENTHAEAPWLNARAGCLPGSPCNAVISKQSMQEYYGSL